MNSPPPHRLSGIGRDNLRAPIIDTDRYPMKFGYTIVYVPDVEASLQFFEQAFGFSRRFLHESGTYGELESGETTLAFADHQLAEMNFRSGHVAAHSSPQPLGMELGMVTDEVQAAHAKALAQGASELSPPSLKPWGQTVSYLRCPDGTLVELCTPIAG
jgi:lactoylglutathione lyase